MAATALQCPSCQAPLPIDATALKAGFARCEFCGTTSHLNTPPPQEPQAPIKRLATLPEEVEALDQWWSRERLRHISDSHGNQMPPQIVDALYGLVVFALILALVYVVIKSTRAQVTKYEGAFCVGFALTLAVVYGGYRYSKYRTYDQAVSSYREKRRQLLALHQLRQPES